MERKQKTFKQTTDDPDCGNPAIFGPVIEVLTVKEACEFLRMKQSKLYSLTSAKTIPHSKPGNQLLFLKHELIAWLKQHHKGPDVVDGRGTGV